MLTQLRRVIDPDFGEDIVTCGFVKALNIAADGKVALTLELTTPACPVKEMFQRQSTQVIKVSSAQRAPGIAQIVKRGHALTPSRRHKASPRLSSVKWACTGHFEWGLQDKQALLSTS